MKDIYRLLNEVEIDEMEMIEIENETEISMVEKARVKKRLMQSIRKNKGWTSKRVIAAALAGAFIASMAYIGINNPAYAATIPVIGDIFRFFDNGRTGVYDLYKENANDINITKESSGIQMTMKDAIFDGKTIYFTYELKSDRDLGEYPMPDLPALSIENYSGGLTGGNGVKKIAEGTYIGHARYTIEGKMEQAACYLMIDNIRLMGTDKVEKIQGKWSFTFQLKAVENKEIIVNKSTEKEGFTITIDKITKTPISFIMEYSQKVPPAYASRWMDVCEEFVVRDDVGNVYEGEQNGGHGDISTGAMKSSMTFRKLDERATKLIITPKYEVVSDEVASDESRNETSIKPQQTNKVRTFSMDEIIIEVK